LDGTKKIKKGAGSGGKGGEKHSRSGTGVKNIKVASWVFEQEPPENPKGAKEEGGQKKKKNEP